MQYENNLEKLKAEKPEGATHTDNLGEYWKHENGSPGLIHVNSGKESLTLNHL